MSQQNNTRKEVIEVASKFVKLNNWIFQRNLKRFRIGQSKDLAVTMGSKVESKGDGTVIASNFFLRRGRFVDMGVGKGQKFGRRNQRLGKRKPKKWYGPAWYGRLNDLQGVVQTQMNEQALDTFKQLGNNGNKGR